MKRPENFTADTYTNEMNNFHLHFPAPGNRDNISYFRMQVTCGDEYWMGMTNAKADDETHLTAPQALNCSAEKLIADGYSDRYAREPFSIFWKELDEATLAEGVAVEDCLRVNRNVDFGHRGPAWDDYYWEKWELFHPIFERMLEKGWGKKELMR